MQLFATTARRCAFFSHYSTNPAVDDTHMKTQNTAIQRQVLESKAPGIADLVELYVRSKRDAAVVGFAVVGGLCAYSIGVSAGRYTVPTESAALVDERFLHVVGSLPWASPLSLGFLLGGATLGVLCTKLAEAYFDSCLRRATIADLYEGKKVPELYELRDAQISELEKLTGSNTVDARYVRLVRTRASANLEGLLSFKNEVLEGPKNPEDFLGSFSKKNKL